MIFYQPIPYVFLFRLTRKIPLTQLPRTDNHYKELGIIFTCDNKNITIHIIILSKGFNTTNKMIQRNDYDFATKALKSIENAGLEEQPSRKLATMSYPGAGKMLCGGNSSTTNTTRSSPLKRLRSRSTVSGSFDMGDFLKASQQVEETIAFPAIEWPSFDDDDSSVASSVTKDDDEEEDYFQHSRKRQCRGLVRCDRSCNLSSLWEIAKLSERSGSNGSLS